MFRPRTAALMPLFAALVPSIAAASANDEADATQLDRVVVTAPYGTPLADERVAGNIQTADAADIELSQALDLTDFLSRKFSSVHINHAQNNPLQPDLNFRGFTASPLLGLSQGLAVYENGVRINEPFGDTVNWDLIALSTIDSTQMLAGSNPVFGLNSLGGALSLQTKNGFNHAGGGAELFGGSFGRYGVTVQQGDNNGRFGYYVNADYFAEQGWREDSASNATRLFGALSHRSDNATADLSVAHAQSELRGNGATPVDLLEIDRTQVFTHPDITENKFSQVIAEGSMRLSDKVKLAGNAYYRQLDTHTFNGDATVFSECTFVDGEFLVEDDFTDVNDDGRCVAADDDDIEPVLDSHGNRIASSIAGHEQDAINNRGRRQQESYGASAQTMIQSMLGSRRNDLTFGASFARGETSFASDVEVGYLLPDRSTAGSGLFADEFRTAVDSTVTTSSFYFTDTLDLTDQLSVNLAGRYDRTEVQLEDQSGQSEELDGDHSFARFNPSIGATYRFSPQLLIYASWSESARAPTPVELACASEDAPCNLPNAFLADPPLDMVVARSIELGARGVVQNLRWHLGVFDTRNQDDILFQTTGGAQANVGYFANVSDTDRAGLEFSVSQQIGGFEWSVDYTYLKATFVDDFIVNSPHHPALEDDADVVVGEGKLLVEGGSFIPGMPQHQANIGVDYAFGGGFSVGSDASYRSGVYLRGDEPNELEKTSPYWVVNLRGEYRFNDSVVVFARIENLFDREYETFGLLGDPSEVLPDADDPRFLGAAPPFGAWVGVRVKW